jgi:hypothetical protein
LEESTIAGARNAVEVGIDRASGSGSVDGDTLSIAELVASFADTGNAVVEGIGGTDGNSDALSTDVLSTGHTDTSIKRGIISLILIAGRLEVGLNTVSVDVLSVTQKALTNNSVEGLIGSALLTVVLDPEVSSITVALSVLLVGILTTIDVVVTLSIDDGVSGVAQAAVDGLVEGGVERAELNSSAGSVN